MVILQSFEDNTFLDDLRSSPVTNENQIIIYFNILLKIIYANA